MKEGATQEIDTRKLLTIIKLTIRTPEIPIKGRIFMVMMKIGGSSIAQELK
jgi:hypothetical protein